MVWCSAGWAWLVLLFEQNIPGAQITSFDKALWWGITATFMTVGYGDLVPMSPAGRIAAGFLMFSGVAAIGIISAKISAYFLKEMLFEGRGSVDKSKIRNHFIVCGWKDDMQDLLKHILLLNKQLRPHEIVIVANRSHEDISALKTDPKLTDVTVIIGDYFQQSTLQRAAPEAARKVLIPPPTPRVRPGRQKAERDGGRRPDHHDGDRALEHRQAETVVAAEIIDPSLDHYLKMAQRRRGVLLARV